MASLRMIGIGVGALALAGAVVWAVWPEPTAVDMARVSRAPLQVTVGAEGITRVREPYAITAPITGMTTRSPVQVGDPVTEGDTVVAIIQPADPALLDVRTRLQAEAAVTEAEAAVRLAESNLERAQSTLDHVTAQLARDRALAERGTIPRRMLEDIEAQHVSARQGLSAAESELDLHRATLARTRAQLVGPATRLLPGADPGDCCVEIVAPHTGTVLEVSDLSARLVQAGSPLLVIGDLTDLEIELDLLSSDAVRVPPGARALVDRWGGDGLLEARVRRIEPAAFTRVSALGIEEQRVRLRLDFDTPPEGRNGLGDRFRVHVRVVLWEGEEVLQLPQAALFRHAGGWAVFALEEGRARLTPVEIGHQSGGQAELLDGLAPGAQVVLYPPSALDDGARVRPRAE
ncbi:HlyD family efflux transporter periplasmic adaptor subunit [Pararhodobacter sp. SW119]|uniref:efflux RND transporter periplasmic adaptor subunit n=1 Tax=Pararhodobacter sp. SW119 TaxID=2780075 RepID=UPI001ADFEC47|nr:HlyD family efflux transporter periplasmic adaptor subunit [Pararhodobacter sp. SW119]